MNVIQIGSLTIMLKWVLLGSAILLGLVVIKLWLQRTQTKENNKKIFDTLTNSLFIMILAWKGSLILLEPKLILKSPLSFLYFTGGTKGLVIATLISFMYFIYKNMKAEISSRLILQTIFIFSLTVLSCYHFTFLFALDENDLYHLLVGTFTLIILYFILIPKEWRF
ncbi:hypothetical protein [Neobacillus sp. PS2-9]|uniref:hypothetical protein n=1 Tax=Neobacillus sp. PS2-9 TaxID=3070676 RepID=UPI0027E013EE|nr:hypothetical protein [Neobacillus sp. PS2-9]WML60507.1 hypothetical protein RCG25_12400 [Neobacillus sp. PS2-9]